MVGQRYLARPGTIVGVALVAIAAAAGSATAQPAIGSQFTAVQVDGSATGWAVGAASSVEFDGAAYHMWYRTSMGTIDGINHAVSTDGVHFTRTGALSFTANPFPTGTPPYLYYENTAFVGGAWRLLHWTYNGGAGTYPAYNYNVSVSDVGTNAAALAVTHQGPVGGGTAGQSAGSFGIVGGYWYGQCGPKGQDLCRAAYTDGTPPSVSASIYPPAWQGQSFFTAIGAPDGYLNNFGKVVSGPAGLEMFLTVRQDQNGARYNQQVYWSHSTDGGANWSDPVALLTAPLLDGAPFGANFAHPVGVYVRNQPLLYFSTQLASGAWVVAVSPPAGVAPEAIALLSTAGAVALAAFIAVAGAAVLALRSRAGA